MVALTVIVRAARPVQNSMKADCKGLLLFSLLTQAIDWNGVITEYTVLSSGELKVWHNGLQVAAFGSTTLDAGHYIQLQTNCLLVIRDMFGNPVWFSSLGTLGTKTGCSLRAQSDGNLVVYDDSGWAQWVSNTVLPDCGT
eukprot:g35910.t1